MPAQLLIIGGGNMGGAIAISAAEGSDTSGAVVVAEPDGHKRAALEQAGRGIVRSVPAALDGLLELDPDGLILLAVKPQMFAPLATELAGSERLGDRLVVSIMAGISTDRVRTGLTNDRVGQSQLRVVRVMPNIALLGGHGMTAVCSGKEVSERDIERVESLFRLRGQVARIRENLMDAFTALAGSGPAYIFFLAETMIRAAQEMGFDPRTADQTVRQTILGAARMLAENPANPPEKLRAAVTSKGGTTEAAMAVMDQLAVSTSIVQAILRGRDRGAELGGQH